MGYQLKPAKHAKWSLQIVPLEDAKQIVPDAEPSGSDAGLKSLLDKKCRDNIAMYS
jgi:hypothetical protein